MRPGPERRTNGWSGTAYHPDTRSLLVNGEDKPSRNSYDDLRWNADGSIDLSFGPTPPEGYEQAWARRCPTRAGRSVRTD